MVIEGQKLADLIFKGSLFSFLEDEVDQLISLFVAQDGFRSAVVLNTRNEVQSFETIATQIHEAYEENPYGDRDDRSRA